ncbi:uncharacterized protein FFC1_03785 [Fusarium fujikuroi]|nr:uncharacterized protein FFC1_03785 [Fusarium fujikuroi]
MALTILGIKEDGN